MVTFLHPREHLKHLHFFFDKSLRFCFKQNTFVENTFCVCVCVCLVKYFIYLNNLFYFKPIIMTF